MKKNLFVISFLAARFSNNVRELEGALNRLLFYTINMKPTKHITMEVATEAIQGLVSVKDDRARLSEGRIVVDVSGERKMKLTVRELMDLFSQASGRDETDDKLLLS